ncbi:putative E3 ubiquitin-protein ligase makorin-1 [Styela clava]
MASGVASGTHQSNKGRRNGRKEEPNSTKVLCRYHVHGVCRFGDRCKFSHDLDDQPNLVCTFHKKGVCAYGKECRYDHVRDKNTRKHPSPVYEKPSTTADLSSFTSHDDSWVNAAEFVPGKVYSPRVTSSYSNILKSNDELASSVRSNGFKQNEQETKPAEELCPYYLLGECRYGDECVYLHGKLCDMCGLHILHPTDPHEQEKHKEECLASHEEDMKESFKVAQSCEVTCGICMEVVWEKKEKRERKFGILENCSHAFCLDCIRKWRSAKSFNNTVVKACPECRVSSSFVTPSDDWVSDKEEKKKLIEGYKDHLSKKSCKHFDQGRGKCPFGANCFYLHAYPDGTKQDRSKIPKRARNAEGRLQTFDSSTIWEFIEERHDHPFFDLEDDSMELFDLVYLLGANTSLGDDSDSYDHWDWFLGIGDSDEDSDFY